MNEYSEIKKLENKLNTKVGIDNQVYALLKGLRPAFHIGTSHVEYQYFMEQNGCDEDDEECYDIYQEELNDTEIIEKEIIPKLKIWFYYKKDIERYPGIEIHNYIFSTSKLPSNIWNPKIFGITLGYTCAYDWDDWDKQRENYIEKLYTISFMIVNKNKIRKTSDGDIYEEHELFSMVCKHINKNRGQELDKYLRDLKKAFKKIDRDVKMEIDEFIDS